MALIIMRRNGCQPISRNAAFTLIELLVVIAIIAILAALTLAVSGTVRKMTDRTKCLANLRAVGHAINTYTGEHEGVLPGPFWTWQACWYDDSDFGAIGTILAPYLGQASSSEKQKMGVLVCPSWQRGAPYQQDQSWILNTEVVVNGTTINPWGDADLALANDGDPSSDPTAPDAPKRILQLTDISLVRTWAMQDLDAQNPVRKVPHGIAPQPVHGDKRNALFFDFHAESVALDYKP